MSIANRLASAAVALFGRSDSPVSTSNQSPAVGGGGGWVNWATGQGIMGRDPATSATFGFQMQLPDMLRDNLYYFEPLTGIVVDRPAKDLVRRGVEFKGFEGYDLEALESKLDDLQWLKNISRAYRCSAARCASPSGPAGGRSGSMRFCWPSTSRRGRFPNSPDRSTTIRVHRSASSP